MTEPPIEEYKVPLIVDFCEVAALTFNAIENMIAYVNREGKSQTVKVEISFNILNHSGKIADN